MKPTTGAIIAIDGPDGVGKTTQIELLGKYLEHKGHSVHYTRASGGTPIGEELRKASLSKHPRTPETDLYISLAMHNELGTDIQKRKHAGQTVLVDRSPLTIVAYQVFGSQLPVPQDGFNACEKMLRLWNIDTLFMLEAPQTVLDVRREKRVKASDFFEDMPASFHHRVQEGYKQAMLAAEKLKLPTHIITVDANPPPQVIHSVILKAI